jgi:hypothetical protein
MHRLGGKIIPNSNPPVRWCLFLYWNLILVGCLTVSCLVWLYSRAGLLFPAVLPLLSLFTWDRCFLREKNVPHLCGKSGMLLPVHFKCLTRVKFENVDLQTLLGSLYTSIMSKLCTHKNWGVSALKAVLRTLVFVWIRISGKSRYASGYGCRSGSMYPYPSN